MTEEPPNLRLRAEPPRVMRLSRKVLTGLGEVSAFAVAGALGYALQTGNGRAPSGEELLSVQNRPAAKGLAELPKDYSGLPRRARQLGPPLPSDLGKPILNAGAPPPPIAAPSAGPNPEAQRVAQESEAARVSRLFAQTNQQAPSAGIGVSETGSAGTENGVAQTPPVDAGAAQNMQDRKSAFLTVVTDRRTVSPGRLQPKASPYVVQAGTVIPAALNHRHPISPAKITAQVPEPVSDSPTSHYLLIPQGTRLIFPDGASIVLERQPGADAQGYAGLEDEVDYHWWNLAKAAMLSTLLSVGAEAGSSGQDDDIIRALRQGASNSVSQTGQQIVQRQLNIQPTLTIRPGFPVWVMVTHDLVLAAYAQGGAS